MKDIAPELLEKLQEEFKKEFNSNEKIKKLNKLLEDGTATYKEANELSMEVGDILAKVYQNNLSGEVLPDGKMYYNIAERVIEPTMKQNYELVSTYSQEVQTALNHEAGLQIQGIKPELNQDRIDGIIERVSNEDEFEEIKWILDEPLKNFTQSVVDDSIKTNADFHSKIGLKPKIIRKELGNCCDWCKEVVGVYEYPNVPRDVYRRHRYCRCTVEYYPGDGRIQDVHTKKWIDPEKEGKIQERKEYKLETGPQNAGNGINKIEDDIRNNVIPKENTTNLLVRKQNKHIIGTNEYEAAKLAYSNKNEFGPSTIEIDENKILDLVNKYKGSGKLRINKDGWQRVEVIIDNDEIVGTAINNLTGTSAPTSVFKIHYADDGFHISPDYPSKRRKLNEN